MLGVDYLDHGTSVAGLIVAKGNNGIGVSGVAPEVSFVSRGLDAPNWGSDEWGYINMPSSKIKSK